MTTKQQQLTFEKGITAIPSDAICSDNALENVTGLIYSEGEHHVIQNPVPFKETNKYLLFVHKLPNGGLNYIYEHNNWLWRNDDISAIPGSSHTTALKTSDVTAIGKTLVVNMGGKIRYFLWQETEYKSLGDLPELSIKPTLVKGAYGSFGNSYKQAHGDCSHCVESDSGSASVIGSKQEEYNTFIIGLYEKTLNLIARDKGFAKPFFVRAALEMYDGTYTQITNPILMWPTIDGSTVAYINNSKVMYLQTFFYQLAVAQEQDYTDYTDIVKDVVVFVSSGVNVYDTISDQLIGAESPNPQAISVVQSQMVLHDEILGSRSTYLRVLTERKSSEIMADIESTSVFYRLCSLGLRGIETPVNLASKVDTHTLENLITQEQLKIDDYYSRCPLSASMMYAYNNRLNLAGVERGFFNGFRMFMPFESGDDRDIYSYIIYVRIKTESGYAIVKDEFSSTQIIGNYFYYPDPRADRVTIKRDDGTTVTTVLNVALKEHGGLNGAYYLNTGFNGSYPTINDGGTPITASDYASASNVKQESLGGQLLQSEVNNPFTFLASGYHQVGMGNIIGMAALTTALSQGQFGQYPLTVFTTEGIWGMSVDATGLYTAAHPMSREVALESNPCITQTDGAIFFVSKKGLMVVVGNQVKCVSEQLNGKNRYYLESFFDEGFIAYDYRDSLLWCFNAGIEPARALVYSIKSGTFAWCEAPVADEVHRVVNNYPDYLIQDDAGAIYSLYNKPDRNTDITVYDAMIKTRPLKLENATALKSILQIRHIHDISNYNKSSITLTIEASNNMKQWATIRSLAGTPWKYYRFTYHFNNLKASDTFAGTLLITQERRSDRLR